MSAIVCCVHRYRQEGEVFGIVEIQDWTLYIEDVAARQDNGDCGEKLQMR